MHSLVAWGGESKVGVGRRLPHAQLWVVEPVPLVQPCRYWELHSRQAWADWAELRAGVRQRGNRHCLRGHSNLIFMENQNIGVEKHLYLFMAQVSGIVRSREKLDNINLQSCVHQIMKGCLVYAGHHAKAWGYGDESGKDESAYRGAQILESVYNRAL